MKTLRPCAFRFMVCTYPLAVSSPLLRGPIALPQRQSIYKKYVFPEPVGCATTDAARNIEVPSTLPRVGRCVCSPYTVVASVTIQFLCVRQAVTVWVHWVLVSDRGRHFMGSPGYCVSDRGRYCMASLLLMYF